MTKITLGGNMPNAKVSNGLLDMADDIGANPKQTITAIVEIDVNYLKTDPRTKNSDPVLQLTHIEPLTGKNLEDATKILDRAFTARTNEKSRPRPEDEQLDLSSLDDSVG